MCVVSSECSCKAETNCCSLFYRQKINFLFYVRFISVTVFASYIRRRFDNRTFFFFLKRRRFHGSRSGSAGPAIGTSLPVGPSSVVSRTACALSAWLRTPLDFFIRRTVSSESCPVRHLLFTTRRIPFFFPPFGSFEAINDLFRPERVNRRLELHYIALDDKPIPFSLVKRFRFEIVLSISPESIRFKRIPSRAITATTHPLKLPPYK